MAVKSNTLFDILNSIQSKEYRWEELPEEYVNNYSQFMINRFLSSYDYLIPLIEKLTVTKLSNEQHYKLLFNWVKKTKHYFNYNSYKTNKDDDKNLLIAIQKEYNITERESKRFCNLLTEKQKAVIKNKWQDYLKYNT